MKKRISYQWIYPIITAVLFFAVWMIVTAAVGKEYIIPGPAATFRALGQILKTDFFRILLSTFLRAFIAFLTSFTLAAAVCAISVFVKGFHKIISPIVTFLRATPTMSVIMICLIWLDGNAAPIVIASLVLFPMLYAAFYASYQGVDGDLVELATLYRVSPLKRITGLYLPCMLPSVLSASKSNIGLAVKLTVAAEVMSQTGRDIGIGISMQMTRYTLDTAGLLAWTIVAVLLAAFLETCVFLIAKITIKGVKK